MAEFSRWTVQQNAVIELVHSLCVLRKELREVDRRRRLEEMERDAAAHQELRYSRVSAAKKRDESDTGQNSNGDRGGAAAQEAEFLSRMNRETVMAGAGGSLEQRIAQRRHYHERSIVRD